MIRHLLRSHKVSITVQFLLILMTAAGLVIWSYDSLSSLSIDLAHHYALTARLSDSWIIPYAGDASLAEMNFYPRSSHLIAALIGKITHSPFWGMHITALLSVFLVWSSIAYILSSLPKKPRIVVYITSGLLLLINHYFLQFDLHASEIDVNYFFAQLVAQAFILIVLALTLRFDNTETKKGWRNCFLILAIYIAVGIHLLPALELLCFYIALLGSEFYQQWHSNKNKWLSGSHAAGYTLAASAALFLHPAFARMRQISLHNGELHVQHISATSTYLIYSSIIFISSCLLCRIWFLLREAGSADRFKAVKYIGLYGMAVSGLCMAQVLALCLGLGSEYAVKKYVFGLNTVSLIEAAVFTFLVIHQLHPRLMCDNDKKILAYVSPLLPSLFTTIAFFCVFPSHHLFSASDVARTERQLLDRRKLFSSQIPGKFDFVYAIVKSDAHLAYMFSTGLFQAPRVLALSADVADWNYVASIFTSAGSAYDIDVNCRRAAPENSLVVLDGSCLSKKLGIANTINFTSLNKNNPCTAQGLSVAEDFGTWTESNSVHIRCPLPVNGQQIKQIEIDASGFLVQKITQRVALTIDGKTTTNYLFDDSHSRHVMVLDLPEKPGKDAMIDLVLPDAVSGKKLGVSNDVRQLGIAIKSITFK